MVDDDLRFYLISRLLLLSPIEIIRVLMYHEIVIVIIVVLLLLLQRNQVYEETSSCDKQRLLIVDQIQIIRNFLMQLS